MKIMNWNNVFACTFVAFTLPISALSGTEQLPDFNVLKEQAEQGDMESQFQLGRCYAFGTGTEKMINKPPAGFAKRRNKGMPRLNTIWE